jgi:predicted transcriptional regulator
VEVLRLAKGGVTKKAIMDKFSFSRSQVRKVTADLVNKDLLIYHLKLKSFMTTAKGNIYLKKQSMKSTVPISPTDLRKSGLRPKVKTEK